MSMVMRSMSPLAKINKTLLECSIVVTEVESASQ